MVDNKGLIRLSSKNAILEENLRARLIEGLREPCSLTFCDFDDVSFSLNVSEESESIVKVNMAMRDFSRLRKNGTQEILDREFPGFETTPDKGFDVALKFDCEKVRNKEELLAKLVDLRKLCSSGPLEKAGKNMLSGGGAGAVMCHAYRKTESIYVAPLADQIVVVYLVDFEDSTEKALGKVFLQEFVDAQRKLRHAPVISYRLALHFSPHLFTSRQFSSLDFVFFFSSSFLRLLCLYAFDFYHILPSILTIYSHPVRTPQPNSPSPPAEIAGQLETYDPDMCGFVSLSLEKRHVQGSNMQTTLDQLTAFRQYLHYHIKASKTYLHMRMRKRMESWMKVLKRAMPEVETTKKTAAGKTFVKR
jgi:actin related protein 2/3 complex subunit 2